MIIILITKYFSQYGNFSLKLAPLSSSPPTTGSCTPLPPTHHRRLRSHLANVDRAITAAGEVGAAAAVQLDRDLPRALPGEEEEI